MLEILQPNLCLSPCVLFLPYYIFSPQICQWHLQSMTIGKLQWFPTEIFRRSNRGQAVSLLLTLHDHLNRPVSVSSNPSWQIILLACERQKFDNLEKTALICLYWSGGLIKSKSSAAKLTQHTCTWEYVGGCMCACSYTCTRFLYGNSVDYWIVMIWKLYLRMHLEIQLST